MVYPSFYLYFKTLNRIRSMLYLYSPDQQSHYFDLLTAALPDCSIACWPQDMNAEAVTHVVAWKPPVNFFSRFPNLQVIFTLGAGVDKFLQRDDIPEHVTIIRLTDAGMAQQMTEYALYGLLHFQRKMDIYRHQQQAQHWQPQPTRLAKDTRVTVLGLGHLGVHVAQTLANFGYPVQGWSRSPRDIPNIHCVHGYDMLDEILPHSDVLFCLLPATDDTHHLLNAQRLALLPANAAIINAGRGALIDEQALLSLLDQQHLRFALLDVFETEPLPDSHPFWSHPSVIITPHVAADTIPEEAVSQIVSKMQALANGQAITGIVDRLRGY
jgi:glyoxylate/hydroxypyruvate reductase A